MKLIYFVSALILAMLLKSCSPASKSTETIEDSAKDTSAVVVANDTLAEAKDEYPDGTSGATNVANHTSFNGVLMIRPQNHATLTAIMGGVVEELPVLPGRYIRKGTLLATLKNPDFIDLQQNYLEALAQLTYLEAEFNRQEVLSHQEAASQKKYQQTKADYLSMKSRKEAAAAQLLILGVDPVQLEQTGIQPYLRIKAPFDGYVTAMDINLGSFITPGGRICDVINKNESLLCLTAYEKDLDQLSEGKTIYFKVNGLEDNVFKATLLSIGQEVAEESRSLQVYAKVSGNNARFRPGMYVTAWLAPDNKNGN